MIELNSQCMYSLFMDGNTLNDDQDILSNSLHANKNMI